ncbi:MAG: NAD(P)-binding protein, partial [Candidatus Binatia bacterium]
MPDHDAIIIGAGHNGLTAAAILQRAGLRTVVLEKNKYTGGMASTVELFDGYHFEIAGSVLFPIPDVIMNDLGLDTVPTVDTDIMAVNIGRPCDEPIIFYSNPEKFMAHVADRHGMEAVMGMAEIMRWCWAPARAVHRFECLKKPPTLDEMFASATNEE